MLKKIKLMFVLGAFLALVACDRDPNAWMKGEYGGAAKLIYKISVGDYPAKDIESRTGSFSFLKPEQIYMGHDTSLDGCRIEFYGDADNSLIAFHDAYRGETKNDLGCLAVVKGEIFRIKIVGGSMKHDPNGETVLNVRFRKDYDGEYEYELRARKTSWFD